MSTKKLLASAFLPLLLAGFLQAQSVTDLSKKEKERRAAIKKPVHVVTNADLAKVKKRPAVEVVAPEKAGGEQQTQAEGAQAGQEGVTPPGAEQQQAAGAEQKPAEQVPAEGPTMSEKEFRTQMAELKIKSDQAQEQVDLYTLKMNGLWQEFYSLDDMKSRELIQLQISETYDKLTKAQLDADKAKKGLDDFMANARREGVPSIWIR